METHRCTLSCLSLSSITKSPALLPDTLSKSPALSQSHPSYHFYFIIWSYGLKLYLSVYFYFFEVLLVTDLVFLFSVWLPRKVVWECWIFVVFGRNCERGKAARDLGISRYCFLEFVLNSCFTFLLAINWVSYFCLVVGIYWNFCLTLVEV